MEFLAFLHEFISHLNDWLSFKVLAFISFAACILICVGEFLPFYDKLYPMYDAIVPYFAWTFLLSAIGLSFKALCVCASFLQNKFFAIQQKKQAIALEQKNLQNLLSLSHDEILILEYLMLKQSHSAYFSRNDLAVCNLERKGYIKQFFDASKSFEDFHLSLDLILLHAFYLSDDILQVMQHHHHELNNAWQDIKNKKKGVSSKLCIRFFLRHFRKTRCVSHIEVA